MNNEELMNTRYLVIGEYPHMDHKIGDILYKHVYDGNIYYSNTEVFQYTIDAFLEEDIILKYPKLFRKLEWYEFREHKDMPQYVKFFDSNFIKVEYYCMNNSQFKRENGDCLDDTKYFSPSTEEEYNNFKNK